MLKVYNDGRWITAALSGDIDHHTAHALRAELDELICFPRPEHLILDFAEVEFIDSSGIGLILEWLKTVRAASGDIFIKNARADIAAVIRLSGLEGLLVKAERKSYERI